MDFSILGAKVHYRVTIAHCKGNIVTNVEAETETGSTLDTVQYGTVFKEYVKIEACRECWYK